MTPAVAVIGGGPAGAAVAITLARRGVSVTVVEQAPAPRPKPGECLPPGAGRALEFLGVKCALVVDRAHLGVGGTRACWGRAEPLDHAFIGGNGWLVDRAALERLLSERAMQLGVVWRWGRRLEGLSRGKNGWNLRLDGSDLHVAFVVDASGRRAALARRLDARRIAYDRLVAVGGVLERRTPRADARVLVEAVPSGWWYSAALAAGSLVVS